MCCLKCSVVIRNPQKNIENKKDFQSNKLAKTVQSEELAPHFF